MNELLKVFLSLSLSGTLLILILMLCKPLFKPKLSKQWQYYIWIVVIARLLLPIAPETSLIGNIFQAIDNVGMQAESTARSEQIASDLPETNFTTNDAPAGDNGGSNDEQPGPKVWPQQDILNIALQNIWLVWLIVAIAFFIRKITVYQSFVKYVKAGRVEISDIALWERFGKLVEKSGVKRAVGIYTNSLISSPILIGFFRPCIILPTTEMSETDFQYTILHELTHYRRLDMFYKWLAQITICLHWFNPFVYLMGHEINRACELACDEAVIKNLDTDGQRAYGDTLLNALGAGGSYKNSLASVTLTENKKLIKERLDAIMSYKKKSRLAICASFLLTILLLCGFTFAGAYAASSQGNVETPPSYSTQKTTDNNAVWDLGEVLRWNISVESENVIVRRGGTSFQIEVSPESKDNYLLEDYMHVITERFQEREIALKRKEGLGIGAVYSTDIIITVPDNAEYVLNVISTTSGNISIDNIHANKIFAVSESGSITITNSFASDYVNAKSPNGTVTLTNTTSDGYISIIDINNSKLLNEGSSHLSMSGYSQDEFEELLRIALDSAITICEKEKLGIPKYAGELFDLDDVKGAITFYFDLENSNYTTLAVDVDSNGEVTGYDYWKGLD